MSPRPLSRSFFFPDQTHPDKEQVCPAAMAFSQCNTGCETLDGPQLFWAKMNRFAATSVFSACEGREWTVTLTAASKPPSVCHHASIMHTDRANLEDVLLICHVSLWPTCHCLYTQAALFLWLECYYLMPRNTKCHVN